MEEKKKVVKQENAKTGVRWVGIDMGKSSYVLRLIDENGKITGWDGKTNKEGRKELYRRLRPTDKIAIESCSLAFTMNKEFKELTGTDFYILNPNKLFQIYMTDKKTDKEDALKLAKEIRDKQEEDLPRVNAPKEKMKEMRNVMSEYREIVKFRTMKINRLHSVYEHAGITDLKRSDLKTKTNREKNLKLLNGYEKEEAQRLMHLIDLLESQKMELENKIKEEENTNEQMQIVEQIPGIGKTTAFCFVGVIGDPNRFTNMTRVSSYLGFIPKIDCSSKTNHYGHITKKGNAYLRGLLVQAAWVIVRSNNGGSLKEKYNDLIIHGMSKKKAVVAIARKLAELMYTLLKNHSSYEPRPYTPRTTYVENLADQALSYAAAS